MLDFQVAFDKLAQFHTADQVANYLVQEGAKGFRGMEDSCPIARWMRDNTREEVYVNTYVVVVPSLTSFEPRVYALLTPAMQDFVEMYDYGHCPELEERME